MKQVDLLNGPIDSSLRKFAAPLAISFIINLLYAWIDLFFVSRLGDSAVAALGISERIWFFTFAIGSGFAVGSGIIIARRIGEGRSETASTTALQSIAIMFVMGIVLSASLHYFLDEIQYVLGIKGSVKLLSKYYFTSLVWGVPFNFLIFQLSSIMRSAGNSSYPMYMLLLSNVVNIILTPIFIFGFGYIKPMGIFGAGLGTSLSYFVASIFGLYMLFRKFKIFRINFLDFSFNKGIVISIFKLGIPASLQMIVVSITSMGLAANANLFGTEILSTYIIGLRVDLLVSMSIFAFGASMEVISGQNMGTGNVERIFLYLKSAIKQLTILLILFGTLVFLFGDFIGSLFSDDEYIIREVSSYLRFAVFGYIPFAIGILSIRTISGGGDYFRSLKIVSVSLVLIQLAGAYLLSKVFQTQYGIWASIVASMIFFGIFAYLQVSKRDWVNKKV